MRLAGLTTFTLGVALAPLSALAQTPACAAMDTALPPQLSSWSAKTEMKAAAAAADLGKAALQPGKAVTATLSPTRSVAYVAQPEKPGGSVASGGLFQFDIAEAGTYQVVLGSGAWIDVLSDGKPVVSTAHGHGPECSTARKIVDFPLEPGRYVLQVSANADPALAVLVTRRP